MFDVGAGFRFTVTLRVPDSSPVLCDAVAKNAEVFFGGPSLATMVSVCVFFRRTLRCPPMSMSVNSTVSSPSGVLSSMMVTGMVAVAAPASTVTEPSSAV